MDTIYTVKQLAGLVKKGKKAIKGMEKVLEVSKMRKEKGKSNLLLKIVAVIAILAAACGIAYAIYRYLKPDYLEDSDEEDFEDDFFEDETPEEEKSGSTVADTEEDNAEAEKQVI